MRKAIINLAMLTLLLICISAIPTAAQAPGTITYQGKLTNSDGGPITTQQSVVFSIYAAVTGGSALWTETISITPNSRGVFTVELGATAAFGASVFDGSKRYLGIKIGSDAEMTPRQLLTSAPYAMATNIADGAVTTAKLASNAVNSAKVLDGSLSMVDISNEPGIASGYSSLGLVTLTSTDINLDSAILDVPAAGFVVVVASVYYVPNHTTGTRDLGRFCITRTSAVLDYTNMANITTPANAETWSDMPQPVCLHAVYSVAAGVQKFYLVADAYAGVPRADKARIVAMYFPTSYGAVGVVPASLLEQTQTGTSDSPDNR